MTFLTDDAEEERGSDMGRVSTFLSRNDTVATGGAL
jgi:argininosuccinate lyase